MTKNQELICMMAANMLKASHPGDAVSQAVQIYELVEKSVKPEEVTPAPAPAPAPPVPPIN